MSRTFPFLLVGLFWIVFVMMALAGFMRRLARSAADEAKRGYRPPITIEPVERPAADARPLPRRRRATVPGTFVQPLAGEVDGQGGRASSMTGSLGVGRMEGYPAEARGRALPVEEEAARAYATPAYPMGPDQAAGAMLDASTLFSEMKDIARGVVMSEVLGRPASAFAPVRPRLLRRWRI